MLYKELKRRK